MKTDRSHKYIKGLKKSIRASIQKQRDSLSRKSRYKKSRSISRKLMKFACYKDSKRLLLYYPFRSEIDIRMIIKDALARGKETALPRVGENRLDLYYIKNLSGDLEPGNYDIMEPIPARCVAAEPDELDLVIVPGVGFDRNLNRLGYGGGFYDRLLKQVPESVPKIALAFDLQIMDNIPVSEHDLKVDMLITESFIYKI